MRDRQMRSELRLKLIWCLQQTDLFTQIEMARALKLHPTVPGRVLRRLQEQGLAEVVEDERGRRWWTISDQERAEKLVGSFTASSLPPSKPRKIINSVWSLADE